MTDTKHTPGPWICPSKSAAKYGFPRWDVMAKDDDCAASVARVLHFEDMPQGQREANARLIAAAPDLLTQIEEIADYLDNGTPIRPGTMMHEDIHAAIAKAKGEA